MGVIGVAWRRHLTQETEAERQAAGHVAIGDSEVVAKLPSHVDNASIAEVPATLPVPVPVPVPLRP